MQTCVVPCGKQQNTASTSEKLASAIAIRFGRFYRKKDINQKIIIKDTTKESQDSSTALDTHILLNP